VGVWVSRASSFAGKANVNDSWLTSILDVSALRISIHYQTADRFATSGFHRLSSLLWTALTPRFPTPLSSPIGHRSFCWLFRQHKVRRGLPWSRHVSIPIIPAPTTLQAPVLDFAFSGRLAHLSRRIAFTCVPG